MNKDPALFLLTTTDNPHSPFDDWTKWYMEDLRLGHDTCGLLARLSNDSELFNEDADLAAMRDVVTYNFSGKHIMVTKEEFDELIKAPGE